MKTPETLKILLKMLADVDYVLSRGPQLFGWCSSVSDLHAIDNTKEHKTHYQALKRLEKRKAIELKKEGEQLLVKLTDSGFAEALKMKILSCEEELPSFEACMVVFDVPEDLKDVRNMFRRLLKQAGFFMVQRSVWETTHDVVNELDELVTTMKAEKYILVYRVMRKCH